MQLWNTAGPKYFHSHTQQFLCLMLISKAGLFYNCAISHRLRLSIFCKVRLNPRSTHGIDITSAVSRKFYYLDLDWINCSRPCQLLHPTLRSSFHICCFLHSFSNILVPRTNIRFFTSSVLHLSTTFNWFEEFICWKTHALHNVHRFKKGHNNAWL